DWVLAENATDLEEYALGRERIAKLETEGQEKTVRDGVASLGGQRDTIRREWKQKAAPALAQIDAIWANYESDQNALATAEQSQASPYYHLSKPRLKRIDT
ncbi:MAG: DoxX family protein, partial [Rubripirellula sp.]